MEEKPRVNKCVLAYSGGLDTSIIVPWLRNNYGCEVICYCANLGQADELTGLEEKALASGASKCYVEDLRAEFLTDFAFPTMQAGALYERDYLLGTSMARPLIAKRLVEVAEMEGADAVAHGATGKGNDQVRFELTVMALNPRLRIIAPWREWNIRGRKDALEYAAEYNVPVKAREDRIYSQDRNLWHLSNEGGPLENPWNEPPADMFEWTTSPEQAPNEPEYVELYFRNGIPERINGVARGPVGLLEELNKLGAKHGVGRVDIVENRLVGMKSHGVYETPGGTILYEAHAALEQLCLDRETMHFKQMVALRYARIGLQRPMVHAPAHGAGRVCAADGAKPDGQRAPQALQGQRHPRRATQPLQPLPRGLRDLRRRRRLQPGRRRGLHPPLWPAA